MDAYAGDVRALKSTDDQDQSPRLGLVDLETGEIKRKDNLNIWIFKHYPEHSDNLLCVAAVTSQAVIVKTVMTDWKEREIPVVF